MLLFHYKDHETGHFSPQLAQISYMEKDMDLGLSNVLCAKVDEHAGDWPSQSFVDLFHIANKCVQPKMSERAEVAEV